MKSLKIVGFALIAVALVYGIVGMVQKMNNSDSFLPSFLVAGGMLMTGFMCIAFSKPREEE